MTSAADTPPESSGLGAGQDGQKIRVLIVDDTVTARNLLVYLLNSDPALQVVGVAGDGDEALAVAERLRPDVITMDIHMPKVDGYTATRRIMDRCPTRIVMVTASTVSQEVAATFRSLEAGALAIVGRPLGLRHPQFEASARELIQVVKQMAAVPLLRRSVAAKPALPPAVAAVPRDIQLVAIGASTGGPLALQALLSGLGRAFPAPIAIVQHISPGFTAGFAQWLADTTAFPVRLASHGERMQAGCAYIAPDHTHMVVAASGQLQLQAGPNEHGLCPAVGPLFRSAALSCGRNAAGVLLTGMGRDGAEDLKLMQLAGAVTMVQDEHSAVVYGMPGEALKLAAADHVLPPEAIAALLLRLARRPG